VIPQLPKQNTLQGILLVLGAVFLFACQDTIGKYLFTRYPVPFVQAARYGVNLALTLLIFMPRLGTSFMRTKRWPLASLRGLALALGSLTGGLALRVMPMAETNSILYLAPLALLFLAQPVLGEKVKWFGWVFTAIGFSGLLFIARPGSGLNSMGLIFAFLCLITAVVYPLLSRILSKTESMPTLMFYVGLTGTVYYFAQLPWTMPQVLPTWPHVGLMLALGTVSLISHGLFTMAYARAPVSLLAPFTYAHLAWSTVLGWLVFNQVPDHITFIGIGLIALAGVGNAVMNHRTSRAAQVAPIEVEI
jgi:drug/metabolite transporter (DMT)-like permease